VGCYLDVSMFDSMMHMANISLLPGLSLLAGGTGEPRLEAWGANPRYSVYPTRDGGYVAVSLLEAKLWGEFCRAIGRADLISTSESLEDRHSDHGGKAALYRAAIADYCGSRDRDAVVADMCALGIPILPVLAPEESVKSAHVVARDIAGLIDDEREGQVAELRNPFRDSGLARRSRTPAPAFGENGAEVLDMLGYSKAEADTFAARGII
jgi:crotonobetainyl-CoA:carnitine CoA-transferase CaiB-like acyl-CoA transferase